MYIFFAIIIGYVLGSISFSYLIGKKIAGIDIRKHGSGNAGATNTLRVLGKGPGILVLLLDALKGAAAVWIAVWLANGDQTAVVLAGAGAIIGHNWPIFFGFKGGKGVATTIGVFASLSFYSFLWSALITILVIYITRYVSFGSLVFLTLIPLFMYYYHDPAGYIVMGFVFALLGYIRHWQNILRLIQGKESKIGQSKRE